MYKFSFNVFKNPFTAFFFGALWAEQGRNHEFPKDGILINVWR